MKHLAVVPMRAGSKGVPGKNSLKIGGKYLADLVLRQVISSKKFDYVLCSTDSEMLAAIALKSGAEVPYLRPAEISGDEVPTSEVISHALKYLREEKHLIFSHVFTFQVTSPFVTVKMIDKAIEMLTSDSRIDSIICGTPVESKFIAERQFALGPDGSVLPAVETVSPGRRQDLPGRYALCGNLYATRVSFLEKTGNLVGGNVRSLVVEPILALDIDSLEDVKEARRRITVLRSLNYPF